jgi:hypothetical protein
VAVANIKEDVGVNTEAVQGIDVMAAQIKDVKEDVTEVLRILRKTE